MLERRTVFSILLAAMFCLVVILAIEGKADFLHMTAGFFITFVLGFVLLYMRFAPAVIAVAVLFILGGYGAIKAGWSDAAIGAIGGVATVALLQFGWVGPSFKQVTDPGDYVREQKEIYRQSNSPDHEDYVKQQRELYEKEKSKKQTQAKGDAPPPGAA